MKYISEATSSSMITHKLAFDAVKEALIAAVDGGRIFPVVIAEGGESGKSFSVKSASTTTHCGWKVGSYWASNSQKGIPCHASNIFLLDNETGYLSAVIEASRVNAFRTAAADAVAVETLAKKDACRLAIFGTGHQAGYECRAIADLRELEIIYVVGRDQAKAQAFVDKLKADGLNAEIANAQAACEGADIIVTATTSTAPLFENDWVRPGTHISALGADTKGKQELPVELYGRARLFCDLASQSVEIGEFQHCPETVTASHDSIAMIGEVLNGSRSGRESAEDITIFDSSGISLQDLFVGIRLLEQAESDGKLIELG